MLRLATACLIALSTGLNTAEAGRRRQIDATPFSHAPCSVFDSRPCTPYFCSVFNHGPCIPEIDYPYGENLQLTIESVPPQDQVAKYQKPDHDLDTIGDLFAALRSCWTPPAADIADGANPATTLQRGPSPRATAAQCCTGSGRKRSVLRTEPPGFRLGTFSDQPYVPLADSRAGQWPR